MNEDLRYLLKESNVDKIDKIMEFETFYDKIEDNNMYIETFRRHNSGSYGVFVTKKEGFFSEKELQVAKNFLKTHNRMIEIAGNDKIGVIFDKECDLRPFNIMDRMFNYTKTYKTQSYARMIGLGIMNGIKEYYLSVPDKFILYRE